MEFVEFRFLYVLLNEQTVGDPSFLILIFLRFFSFFLCLLLTLVFFNSLILFSCLLSFLFSLRFFLFFSHNIREFFCRKVLNLEVHVTRFHVSFSNQDQLVILNHRQIEFAHHRIDQFV